MAAISGRLKILPPPPDDLLPIDSRELRKCRPSRQLHPTKRSPYIPIRRVLHTRDQLNAAIATLVGSPAQQPQPPESNQPPTIPPKLSESPIILENSSVSVSCTGTKIIPLM